MLFLGGRFRIRTRAIALRRRLFPQFFADDLAVNGHNLKFLDEERHAWAAVKRSYEGLPIGLPDIRWRAHVAIWAAKHATKLEGDLVECGVFTAILATAICNAVDLGEKRFWLFDTFTGIPVERVKVAERGGAEAHNSGYYDLVDAEAVVKDAIGRYPGVRLVKGLLPESLQDAQIEKISYLSVDLNNVVAEMAIAEKLWDRLVPGAVVVLDDYGWSGYELQQRAWDEFAAKRDHSIVTLPTGQGLLIKH